MHIIIEKFEVPEIGRRAVQNRKTKRLILGALMTAVTVVMTMFVAIPIPNATGAFVNFGDAAVYVAVYILGGALCAVAAGVGSALADLFLGSALYAPATLVIKALMAMCVSAIGKKLSGSKRAFALFIGGLIMPVGYALFEAILYGAPAAIAALPFNLIQYAGGAVIGCVIIKALDVVHKK